MEKGQWAEFGAIFTVLTITFTLSTILQEISSGQNVHFVQKNIITMASMLEITGVPTIKVVPQNSTLSSVVNGKCTRLTLWINHAGGGTCIHRGIEFYITIIDASTGRLVARNLYFYQGLGASDFCLGDHVLLYNKDVSKYNLEEGHEYVISVQMLLYTTAGKQLSRTESFILRCE